MAATNADSVDELHRKLGRNLLRFQEIEVSLKFIMPYVHPDGGAKGLDSLTTMRSELKQKPLGHLIGLFKDSLDCSAPEYFEVEMQKILDARNQLVHHFLQLPGVDFLTVDGVKNAIRYLDQQFQESEAIYAIVRGQSIAVLLTVMDGPAYQTAEFAEYRRRLTEQLPPDLEVISLTDPTKTRWQNTRIVKLLRLAEAETEKMDGMTLLSRAGAFISRQSPDLSHREYGLRRLTDVLLASNLFDVEMRQGGDGRSVTVLYRSRIPADPTLNASTGATEPTGDG